MTFWPVLSHTGARGSCSLCTTEMASALGPRNPVSTEMPRSICCNASIFVRICRFKYGPGYSTARYFFCAYLADHDGKNKQRRNASGPCEIEFFPLGLFRFPPSVSALTDNKHASDDQASPSAWVSVTCSPAINAASAVKIKPSLTSGYALLTSHFERTASQMTALSHSRRTLPARSGQSEDGVGIGREWLCDDALAIRN